MLAEIPNWIAVPGMIVLIFVGIMARGFLYEDMRPPHSREPKDPALGLKREKRKRKK